MASFANRACCDAKDDMRLESSRFRLATGSSALGLSIVYCDQDRRDSQGYFSMMCPEGNWEVKILPIAHIACKTAGRGKPGSDGCRFKEEKNDEAWNIRDA